MPAVRLAQPSGRSQTGIVLSGAVDPESNADPEHPGLSVCDFEYTTEAEFSEKGFAGAGVRTEPCEHPDAAEVPADGAFHPVSATLTGLSSGTTYRYRLSATLGGAKAEVAKQTAAAAFTAPGAPRVKSTSVDGLSSNFAELHAGINPVGALTTYQFQYLTAAQYDANGDSFAGPDLPSTVPAAPVAIGAGGPTGSSSEAVAQHLASLGPATTYEFRVVAENECEPGEHEHPGRMCVTPGEAVSFTTLPAVTAGLPDGRAYELVTPPDKEGAEDLFGAPETNGEYFNDDDGVPSESGEQFMLTTKVGFGPFPAAFQNGYVFSRDDAAGGWTYNALASPALGVQSIGFESILFDPANFSLVAFNDKVGSGTSETGASGYSLLGAPGGPYTTLHADTPGVGDHQAKEHTETVGASTNLGHVVLATTSRTLCPLAGEAETKQDEGSEVLCEYSGGHFTLLDVNNGGKLLNNCGAVLGARDGEGAPTTPCPRKGPPPFSRRPIRSPRTMARAAGTEARSTPRSSTGVRARAPSSCRRPELGSAIPPACTLSNTPAPRKTAPVSISSAKPGSPQATPPSMTSSSTNGVLPGPSAEKAPALMPVPARRRVRRSSRNPKAASFGSPPAPRQAPALASGPCRRWRRKAQPCTSPRSARSRPGAAH